MGRRPLYVVGTGGLAREVAQLARQVNATTGRWDFAGFISANDDDVGREFANGRVVGTDTWLLALDLDADVAIGIGRPAVKARALQHYLRDASHLHWPNIVHPSAIVDSHLVAMGQGNIVTAGCILTVDIRLGDFNLLNLNTTVGHDAVLGDSNVLNPSVNVSGGVEVGNQVLIGTGAQVLENLRIGSGATVGAGAVVTRNVAEGVTVVGIPAKAMPPAPATQ